MRENNERGTPVFRLKCSVRHSISGFLFSSSCIRNIEQILNCLLELQLVHLPDMKKETVIKLGVGAAVAVAAPPLLLYLLGFTSSGIAAGSIAALIQSKIGAVAAGSAFATCQSVGAAGMAATTKVGLGAAGAYVGKKVL